MKPKTREDKLQEEYHARQRAYQRHQTDCSRQSITYCQDYQSKICPMTCSYAKSKLEEELGEWGFK